MEGQLAPALFGEFCAAMAGSPLLQLRDFWSDALVDFLTPRMAEVYPRLHAAEHGFFFALFHLCATLVLTRHDEAARGGATAAKADAPALRQAVDAIKEVLEIFENEPQAAAFFAGIFCDVTARAERERTRRWRRVAPAERARRARAKRERTCGAARGAAVGVRLSIEEPEGE